MIIIGLFGSRKDGIGTKASGGRKIIAYQLPGLLNPPHARIIPGGLATVELYEAYRQHFGFEQQ